MANEDTVLKEVDQELAEERQWAMFRKYGPAAIGGAAALVIGVGAWQFWTARLDSVAENQALEFKSAVETLAQSDSEGRQGLAAIAEGSAGGYGILSQFHRAGSFATAGERDAAISAYRQIYNDGAAPRRLRDLARLKAAYLALSDGRDAVLAHLGDLPQSDGAFAFHANEITGLAALGAKDYETALATFRRLSIDPGAPESVRARAEDFAALAAAARSGVNITGEARLEDLLEAIGDAPPDELAPPDSVAQETSEIVEEQTTDPEAGPEPVAADEDAADAPSEDNGNE